MSYYARWKRLFLYDQDAFRVLVLFGILVGMVLTVLYARYRQF